MIWKERNPFWQIIFCELIIAGIDKSALLREEDNTTEDNQTELNKERKRGKTTGKVKHLVKCFENIL